MTTKPPLDPEDERLIAQYLTKMTQVMRGELRECLHCGAAVERYIRHRPCVYAEPCGHRQWNGNLPKKALGRDNNG